jgi:hypothetical protein
MSSIKKAYDHSIRMRSYLVGEASDDENKADD